MPVFRLSVEHVEAGEFFAGDLSPNSLQQGLRNIEENDPCLVERTSKKVDRKYPRADAWKRGIEIDARLLQSIPELQRSPLEFRRQLAHTLKLCALSSTIKLRQESDK